MGFLNKGDKPTRAERKAQKKAEQAVIKAAEFDARELAKEEKRAARASKSRWGRKKRDAAGDSELHESGEFGLSSPGSHFDLAPGGAHNQGPASDIGAFAPADDGPAPAQTGGSDEFLLEDRVTELPHRRRASDRQPGPGEPLEVHPGDHARVGSLAPVSPLSLQEPDDLEEEPKRRRGFGLGKLKKKAKSELHADPQISPAIEQGTQFRPLPVTEAPAPPAPVHAERPQALHPAPDQQPGLAQVGAQESFATLRRAVGASDEVLVLDDPIIEPVASPTPIKRAVEPLRPVPEAAQTRVDGFSENWVGLWLSEDGAAIYIEEDDDGWFAVTVLPDPTTTCYTGPEYPEIQSYRMPASYAREELGEFDGERLSVITVPGLPGGHRSPMMHIYFLTSIPAAQGGGNRFATPEDPTKRVFIAADLEMGTVNPWSDRDDIEWVDPSVNYYKAPGKLDAYMRRRMSRDDPLN